MKLVRIGAIGSERPAVIDADGVVHRLPAELGDINSEFWTGDSVVEVQRLLDAGQLQEIVSPSERIGSPIAKPEKIVCMASTIETTQSKVAVLFRLNPSFL